jgi:hypothetical protein
MTAQVIETRRQPPLWGVKVRSRFRAVFHGSDARARAEAYATENHGPFEVREKPMTGKERKRLEFLAAE